MRLFLIGFIFWIGLFGRLPLAYGLNLVAEENRVEILPQKFEYEVIPPHKVVFGEREINSSMISVKILRSPSQGLTGFSLEWPSLFLPQTQIRLRNHNQQVLFESNHFEENLILAPSFKSSTRLFLKSPIMESLQRLPFFRFCFLQSEQETFLEFCSAPFALVRSSNVSNNPETLNSGTTSLVRRKTTFDKTSMQLDFRPVENKGLVLLNEPQRKLQVRVEFESGEFLVGELQHKPVQYLNLQRTSDNEIEIVAEGTSPVDRNTVKLLSETKWISKMNLSSPKIYLLGSMGIPMRQDFIFHQMPLPEEVRPRTTFKDIAPTYSSTLTIRGEFNPESSQLRTIDPRDTLEIDGKEFVWTIRGVTIEPRRRNLALQSKAGSYQVGLLVQKVPHRWAEISLGAQINSKKPVTEFKYEHWFEDFGFEALRHLLGGELRWTSEWTKPTNEYRTQSIEGRLLMRLPRGLAFESQTFQFGLGWLLSQTESKSNNHPGVYLSYLVPWGERRSSFLKAEISHAMNSSAGAPLTEDDSNPRLKTRSVAELSWIQFHESSQRTSQFRLQYQMDSFEPRNPQNPSNITLLYGLGWLF